MGLLNPAAAPSAFSQMVLASGMSSPLAVIFELAASGKLDGLLAASAEKYASVSRSGKPGRSRRGLELQMQLLPPTQLFLLLILRFSKPVSLPPNP